MAERRFPDGRMKRVHIPAIIRSNVRRLGGAYGHDSGLAADDEAARVLR